MIVVLAPLKLFSFQLNFKLEKVYFVKFFFAAWDRLQKRFFYVLSGKVQLK